MSEQDDLIGELRATGRALVRRNNVQAKEIAQLRADLAAERQRREAAEKDANELRADNETSAHYAARALHAEAALAAVLPDFYREVCAEAERIIESSGMVSGAHWNAMKIILERRGVHRRCSVSANHPPE